MRKKVLGFVFTAAVLVAMSAPLFGGGTAQAQGAEGDCPDGFELVFVGGPGFDPGLELKSLDINGDGFLCFGPEGEDGPAVTDNSVPILSVGDGDGRCDNERCEGH